MATSPLHRALLTYSPAYQPTIPHPISLAAPASAGDHHGDGSGGLSVLQRDAFLVFRALCKLSTQVAHVGAAPL